MPARRTSKITIAPKENARYIPHPMQPRNIPHPGEYGGASRLGRRKIQRPFHPKQSLHVVFRSTRARGAWSFLHRRHKASIHVLLLKTVQRYRGKLLAYENVGNHLHLLVMFRRRQQLQCFLRVFPQGLMFLVTGARRGNPKGRFFDYIVYSKKVEWGEHFRATIEYFWKNALESLGFSKNLITRWRKASREVPL